MAEEQSKHRQNLEKWAVKGGTVLSYIGVFCALTIALYALYGGSELIRGGHAIYGSIFAGVGLMGLAAAFIYGTRSRREERERKNKANQLTRQ